MTDGQEYIIQKIKYGTVIDHIPIESFWAVVKLLGLNKLTEQMSFGTNLIGKRGPKGVIKIESKELNEREYDIVSVIAPNATVSIIENYQVKEKRKVHIPERIEGIVKCMNDGCVTNNERGSTTIFYRKSAEPLELKCHYCEKSVTRANLFIL